MIAQDLVARLKMLVEAGLFRGNAAGPAPGRAPGADEAQAGPRPQGLRQPIAPPTPPLTPDLPLARSPGTQTLRPGTSPTARMPGSADTAGASATAAPRPAEQAAAPAQSAPAPTARISTTAHLVATLLARHDTPGKPLPLNAAAPLTPVPPAPQPGHAPRLAAALRDAFEQSGLFYEARQARWVAGRLPLDRLMQDPQAQAQARPAAEPGPLPRAVRPERQPSPEPRAVRPERQPPPESRAASAPTVDDGNGEPAPTPAAVHRPQPATVHTAASPAATAATPSAAGAATPRAAPAPAPQPRHEAAGIPNADVDAPPEADDAVQPPLPERSTTEPAASAPLARAHLPAEARLTHFGSGVSAAFARLLFAPPASAASSPVNEPGEASAPAAASPAPAPRAVLPLPERLVPIVQQQLESLASQQYPVQFSPWPGLTVDWLIEPPAEREDSSSAHAAADEAPEWRTRMRLTLPSLGDVEVELHYRSPGFSIALHARSAAAHACLQQNRTALLAAMADASLEVSRLEIAQAAGPAVE